MFDKSYFYLVDSKNYCCIAEFENQNLRNRSRVSHTQMFLLPFYKFIKIFLTINNNFDLPVIFIYIPNNKTIYL